jgi:D,D-heptose 1,7-bisphosphate phosphatase
VTRAVFLDRDGTLNAEVGFVADPQALVVLPGVRHALERLVAAGLRPIVLTNQSGIARGLYREQDLARVHARLHAELGGLPWAYLHCPHHPDLLGPYGGACECRKPKPGLLHQARALLGIEFAGSFLIGDSARDLLPARGLPLTTIHVRSGKPAASELAALQAAGAAPAHQCSDLAAAVDWLLAQQHG